MTASLTEDFDPEILEYATKEELAQLAGLIAAANRSWRPNDRQAVAEALSVETFEILYGGAAGGGKSEWLLKHPEGLSRKYKNHRTLWLRRDYPRLRHSAIDRIEAGLFDLTEEWQWKERDHRLIHRETRSLIQFGHMQNEQEFERYLSSEWDCICIDEATELNKNEYLKLTMRARTSRAKWRKGVRPHMALASNPGSMWLKERFVDPLLTRPDTAVLMCEHDVVIDDEACTECAEMREVEMEPLEYRRAFVPAKVDDNPHVDPLYARRLNLLSPRLRAAYRDGNWDVFEGQFFGEWDYEVHVVEPFEIPDSWPRVRGIDYGQAAPYACLWVAFDENSRAYVYRETYGAGLTARQQARQIQEASVDRYGKPEKYRKTMADPSIFSRQGSGQSIAADYRKEGITPKKANNERVLGWNRVRDFLAIWDDGKPGMVVFSTCRNFIRTVPQLVHSKNNPEDLDTSGEDHIGDAARYILMTKAPRSRSQKQPDSTMQVIRRKARRSAGSHDHSVLGRY